jgi:hypothetical protein
MMDPARIPAALFAIQSVLVKGRCLAAENADHQALFKLLDWAEILPTLITCREEDTTEEFREMLAGLAEDFPDCAGFLTNFDRDLSWDSNRKLRKVVKKSKVKRYSSKL